MIDDRIHNRGAGKKKPILPVKHRLVVHVIEDEEWQTGAYGRTRYLVEKFDLEGKSLGIVARCKLIMEALDYGSGYPITVDPSCYATRWPEL